jgi:hypothetical protein
MSEIKLFNRWTVKKKHFWLAIGLGIPVLCILVFVVFSLFPIGFGGMQSVAYNTADYGFAAPEEPMMEMAAESEYFGDGEMVEQKARSPMAVDVNSEDLTASTDGAAVIERLIIREGNITITVEKTIDTRERINDIVAELAGQGAYVVNASESGRGENRQPYINMVIRVPISHFSSILDQIAARSNV